MTETEILVRVERRINATNTEKKKTCSRVRSETGVMVQHLAHK